MKLYAQIVNEKGKVEGLGGNEYLDIDIKVGNLRLATFTLRWSDEIHAPASTRKESGWCLYDESDNPLCWIPATKGGKKNHFNRLSTTPQEVIDEYNRIKGRKQKGEHLDCRKCGSEAKDCYESLCYDCQMK